MAGELEGDLGMILSLGSPGYPLQNAESLMQQGFP